MNLIWPHIEHIKPQRRNMMTAKWPHTEYTMLMRDVCTHLNIRQKESLNLSEYRTFISDTQWCGIENNVVFGVCFPSKLSKKVHHHRLFLWRTANTSSALLSNTLWTICRLYFGQFSSRLLCQQKDAPRKSVSSCLSFKGYFWHFWTTEVWNRGGSGGRLRTLPASI